MDLAGLPGEAAEGRLLHHPDPEAHNSWDDRDVIEPTGIDLDPSVDRLTLRLPELSHVVVRIH